MSYPGVFQVSFSIQLGLIQTSKTDIPSEISQDEFMGQRIHLGWTCLTNSSGYEFIDWDLAGQIHQRRNLAWRIHGATNSFSETWQDEFIKWGISPDEAIGLRIHQLCSPLTNPSGYEFIKGDSRRTNSSTEKWTPHTKHTHEAHRGDDSHPAALARSAQGW